MKEVGGGEEEKRVEVERGGEEWARGRGKEGKRGPGTFRTFCVLCGQEESSRGERAFS